VSEVNMLGPLDIHQYLLEHDVHHEIVRLPRPAASAEHLAEVLGVTPRRCLAIHPFHALTPDGDVLVLVLAPADEQPAATTLLLALRELLRDRLGPDADLNVAGAALVSRRTDYIAGHLAPLLLPPDVVVVSTRGVLDLATSIIYTATGDGGTALGIAAADLLNLSQAIVLPSDATSGSGAPADRGNDVNTVDRIDLDPAPATPLPSTSITLPLPSDADVGENPPPIGSALPARVRRRAASVRTAQPAAPAVAATAS
jgi:prolyl-tRNA editing enzyme YbaK/EbsC (Cys-tRNA(Pro) deacylase)